MAAAAWDFQNPVSIRFGAGRLEELRGVVDRRALIVTTPGTTQRGLTGRVASMLNDVAIHDGVRANPTLADVDSALRSWRGEGIEAVVGIGGGSAIDVAKILSLALTVSDLTVDRWLTADPPGASAQPLPLVAIPTTAGTGSEVTPFATVWDDVTRRKHSVGSANLHPRVAIIDPELAVTLPWEVTIASGLDAYSQCFEAICNRNATPITTSFAERGLGLVPGALRELRRDPASPGSRAAMAEAALLSGLAISNTRTGLAHSISYPITGHLGIPHGLACALALPGVLAFNAETDDGRLARVAASTGLGSADRIVPEVLRLYDALGVRDLLRSKLGDISALRRLAPEMLTPGRADNNIRRASRGDVEKIVENIEDWLAGETTVA